MKHQKAVSETPAEAINPEIGEIMGDDDPAPVDDLSDFDPALDSLMGDMRDAILQRIRTLQKPWAQMSEIEQYDCANGVEQSAREMIRKTVRLLNDHEWPHAVVTLGEVKIRGEKGIEAKIVCTNIEHNRSVLGEHVGDHVIILMVDSDEFMSARAPAQIDKDQPGLPLHDDEPADGDLADPEPED